MRAGRIEEANSLSQRIGKDIANRNKLQLSHIDPKKNCSICGPRSASSQVAVRIPVLLMEFPLTH